MIYLFWFFRIYLFGFLEFIYLDFLLIPINSTLCYCFGRLDIILKKLENFVLFILFAFFLILLFFVAELHQLGIRASLRSEIKLFLFVSSS